MKLVTFEVATPVGRIRRLGALCSDLDHIVDLNATYAWYLHDKGKAAWRRLADAMIPSDMQGFIEGGSDSLEAAHMVLDRVKGHFNMQEASAYRGPNGETLVFQPSNVKTMAPLPKPPSLRDFIAFEAHVKRGYEIRGVPVPAEWYEMPIYYKGNANTVIGPDEPVVWPQYTKKLDYELEMACIVGKKGRDIDEADAASYIFGYAVLNDFSARDIQMREMKCRLGPAKGKDFATALGPYIVTADEIPYPPNLKMTARVNGEVWSEGYSGTSHWTWAQMIAHLSMDEDVMPGDVLGSGTVGGGCGYELDRWIQPGDVVELEIEKLGKLRNTVITAEQKKRSIREQETKSRVSAG